MRAAHPATGSRDDDRVVVYDLLTYAGNRANLAGLDDSPLVRLLK